MCDLVSALMIGSTVIGARGQKKQANANAEQAKMDAAIARENAEMVDLKTKDAIFRGRNTQRDVRRQGAQVTGSQRATTGASGIDLSYGSPLDMVYETMALVNEDLDTSTRNTLSELDDLKQEKRNFEAQAEGASAAGANYRAAGNINAAGTVLGGLSSVAQYRASIM